MNSAAAPLRDVICCQPKLRRRQNMAALRRTCRARRRAACRTLPCPACTPTLFSRRAGLEGTVWAPRADTSPPASSIAFRHFFLRASVVVAPTSMCYLYMPVVAGWASNKRRRPRSLAYGMRPCPFPYPGGADFVRAIFSLSCVRLACAVHPFCSAMMAGGLDGDLSCYSDIIVAALPGKEKRPSGRKAGRDGGKRTRCVAHSAPARTRRRGAL